MLALWTWFVNSRVGQWLAGIGAIISFLLVVYFKGKSEGKTDERNKQSAQTLENLRNRSETDDQVERKSPDERRRDLSRWVHDDE